MIRTGYFRQDDSGHWYLIPKNQTGRYLFLLDGIYNANTSEEKEDYADIFISEFDAFRLSGGIENYEVTIDG